MTRPPSREGLPRARATSRALWCVFLVGLSIRLLAVALLSSARVAEGESIWTFGHEAACVAESIRRGDPCGDPWCKGTGPSGWLTPVYPAFVALCLELGGGVGERAAWMLFTAQALASAATALVAGRIARVLGGERAGLLAAWLLALHPLSIWYAVQTVWDTTWVAFALCTLVALSLEAPRPWSLRRTITIGLVGGLTVFLNPATLAALPVIFVVSFGGLPSRIAWRRALVFTVAALLPCLPWMVRNARVLGSFALRTNFGVELRVGNLGSAGGRHDTTLHPSHSDAELERYMQMGEVRYSQWARDETLAWITDHPVAFAGLCARRAAQFWIGEIPLQDERSEAGQRAAEDPKAWAKWLIALSTGGLALAILSVRWRRSREARWIGAILLLFPAPYVLTHVSERYRFPIEPLVVALIAWEIEGRAAQGKRRKGTAMLA